MHFRTPMKEFSGSVLKLLESPKEIVIISHPNPDGDAIGSSLGLRRILSKMNHKAQYISPNQATALLNWMPDFNSLISFDAASSKQEIINLIENTDLIFCLDFNAISRLEELGELVKNAKCVKVMIDHHQQPEDFADYMFSDTSFPSTSEMIFSLVNDWGKSELIDKETATLLYTGMATDTGFFQFNNTNPQTLRMAATLIEKGASPSTISDSVFNIFSEKRFRLFGYCMNQKMQLAYNGKVAYMIITPKEAYVFNIQQGDTEGLVNYPFKIKGVELCVLFVEEKGRIKISFRSKGTLDVNTYARKHFNGGGHRNAAGAKSITDINSTISLFLNTFEEIFIENN